MLWRRFRPARVVLATVLGLELWYVALGNWLLATRLDEIGVRAVRPMTLYPGDLRAEQVELSAAGNAIAIRATAPRGRVRLRSLFTGTLQLGAISADQIDVRVSDFAALLRALQAPRGSPQRRIAPAGLFTPFAISSVEVDALQGELGHLRIGGVTLSGKGALELRSIHFTPHLSAVDAVVKAPRLVIESAMADATGATLGGELRFSLSATPREAGVDPMQLSVEVTGDIESTRALFGWGPPLRLDSAELAVFLQATRTTISSPKPFVLRARSVSLIAKPSAQTTGEQQGPTALMMRGTLLPTTVGDTEHPITIALSGRGADAGLVLDLVSAPAAVRWMFEELRAQPYTFALDCVIGPRAVRLQALKLTTERTTAEGALLLSSGHTGGALLLSRGALDLGIVLSGEETRAVDSPGPGWLESEARELAAPR